MDRNLLFSALVDLNKPVHGCMAAMLANEVVAENRKVQNIHFASFLTNPAFDKKNRLNRFLVKKRTLDAILCNRMQDSGRGAEPSEGKDAPQALCRSACPPPCKTYKFFNMNQLR